MQCGTSLALLLQARSLLHEIMNKRFMLKYMNHIWIVCGILRQGIRHCLCHGVCILQICLDCISLNSVAASWSTSLSTGNTVNAGANCDLLWSVS